MDQDDTFEHEAFDDPEPRSGSRRRRVALVVLTVAAVLMCAGGASAVVMLAKGRDAGPTTAEPAADRDGWASPVSTPASAAPVASSAAPPPPPSPTPAATSKKPAPKETAGPPKPPKPSPEGCIARRVGTPAPKSQVRAKLDAASVTQYWGSRASEEQQAIRVPKRLLYAIAHQESGWQSDIIACDGGIGTMQVMPATATWMNQRFGQAYDPATLGGNVSLGATYLAWLISYFGEPTRFATFDVSGSRELLRAVVSAYNYGHGAVTVSDGKATVPNPQYVNNVLALMNSCPCDSY